MEQVFDSQPCYLLPRFPSAPISKWGVKSKEKGVGLLRGGPLVRHAAVERP